TLLTNEQVAELLTMHDCLEAVEEAFRELGEGQAVYRPRSDMVVPHDPPSSYYLFKTFDAVLPGKGLAAVRLTSNVIQESEGIAGAPRRVDTIPLGPDQTFTGLILLFSTETTELLGILQDSLIQVMRAGATHALATKYLSRPDSQVV